VSARYPGRIDGNKQCLEDKCWWRWGGGSVVGGGVVGGGVVGGGVVGGGVVVVVWWVVRRWAPGQPKI
jgi:hypothetical protein